MKNQQHQQHQQLKRKKNPKNLITIQADQILTQVGISVANFERSFDSVFKKGK